MIKLNKIIKILKSYSSVFDGCIPPDFFEDIAIDIKKIKDKETIKNLAQIAENAELKKQVDRCMNFIYEKKRIEDEIK